MDPLRDLMQTLINPYGRMGQRVSYRLAKWSIASAMNDVAEPPRREDKDRTIPRITRRDAEIDTAVKTAQFSPGIADIISKHGGVSGNGMKDTETASRAFIKLAQEKGLEISDATKLLTHKEIEAVPGQDGVEFVFANLNEELQGLADKLGKSFTAKGLANQYADVNKEQNRYKRQERGQAEYESIHGKPIKEETGLPESFNKYMEGAAKIFGGGPPKPPKNDFSDFLSKHLGEGYQLKKSDTDQSKSGLSGFMEAFSNYMVMPTMGKNMQEMAEKDLTRAINKLIGAIEHGEDKVRPGGPNMGTKRTPIRSAIGRGLRWTGAKFARGAARLARPFARAGQYMIPLGTRRRLAHWGAQAVAKHAGVLGVSPAVAARFGAALGPMAAIVPILVAAKKLTEVFSVLSKAAMKTTLSLTQYNGGLAGAFATLEHHRELRKLEMANAVAPWGAARLQAEDRLEEAKMPLDVSMTDWGNAFGIAIAQIQASFYDNMAKVLSIGNSILGTLQAFIPGGDDGQQALERAKKLWDGDAAPKPEAWAAWNAVMGAQGVDAMDLTKRLAGPRPPGGSFK